jgi:heptosyltransferase-1
MNQNQPIAILIVLLGALGDVVRGLSVADGIKKQIPNSIIHWVVEPKSVGIVKLSPSVDKIILFNRKSPIKGIFELIRDLRAASNNIGREYDYVLDMQRHFKSGLISFFADSKCRIGFNKVNSKEFNYLFQNKTIPTVLDSTNKYFHYQEFLKVIGLNSNNDFCTKIIINSDNPVCSLGINSKEYVSVVLGSSWESKNWFFDGYKLVCDRIIKSGKKIVLVGTADQTTLANQLVSAFNQKDIFSFVGKTNLEQLASIIRDSLAGFGPDSGPGHISAALNVPYVAIFGPTGPDRVSPIGMRHLVVQSGIGCQGCYFRKCPGLNTLCMRLIRVEDVVNSLSVATNGMIR